VTDREPEPEDDSSPRLTFHLVPRPVWDGMAAGAPYFPERFAEEGFVHTTFGDANLLAVANRFYQADPRPYLALLVDLDRVAAPWRFDEAGPLYPHIYGPIERDAVVDVVPVDRDETGAFTAVGSRRPASGS
jgi:uncharacterized protein (DUF952 family)